MLGGAARIAVGSLFLPQRMGAMSKSIFCGLGVGHGRAFSILGSGVVGRSSISSLLGCSSSGRVMTVAMRGERAPMMGRCPAALVSFRSVSSGGGPSGGGAGGGAGDGGAGQQQRRGDTGGGGGHVGKEQEQLHIRMAAKRAREEAKRARIKSTVWYMLGVTCFTISMTYASVPLYRIFCQKTGFAGTVKDKDDVRDPPTLHTRPCLSRILPPPWPLRRGCARPSSVTAHGTACSPSRHPANSRHAVATGQV
jgi:hypothetical protein